MALDFDLNDPLPCEDNIIDIPFLSTGPRELREEQPFRSQTQAIIDLEAVDDDVVPSSPRGFYEARSKSRRDHELMVVPDEEIDLYKERIWFPLSHKRRRTTQNHKDANWEYYRNLEVSKYTQTFCPNKPSQVVPAFSCPVCMGQLVKETTTKCGHIFCEKCIKAAIAAQHKCPTCRQKLTVKDTFRIYLPAAC